jgi:hypothetical protein
MDVQSPEVDASAQAEGHGGIELPKLKLPDIHLPDIHFGGKGSSKKGDGNVESTETVTYVVEHQPSIPEGDAEGSTDVNGKVEARGGFEMPKFKLFHRKHGEPSAQGEVVVEPMDVQSPEVDASAQAEGHGGIELPKLKLPDIHLPDIHFGVKGSSKKGDGNVESTETVTYIVQQPEVPAAEADGSADVDGKVEARGGFELPKFKLFHHKDKLAAEGDVAVPEDAGNDVGTAETATFIVQHPDVSVGDGEAEVDAKAGVRGGIEFPKLKFPSIHFGGKSSADNEVAEGSETVTYVVEHPEVPDAEANADVSGDVEVAGKKSDKKWLPDFHFGAKANVDKAGTVDVETPAAASAGADAGGNEDVTGKAGVHGGFEFPKLKLKLKRSPGDAEGETVGTTETVTYVVQPSADVNADLSTSGSADKKPSHAEDGDGDEAKKSGRKWLPDIHFGVHHHKEVNVDTGETVTYVVEQPEIEEAAPSGDDKHRFGVELPKINLHLPTIEKTHKVKGGSKANGGEETNKSHETTVTYVVEHPTPSPSDNKGRIGIDLPKVSLSLHGDKDVKHDEGKSEKRKGKKQKVDIVAGDADVQVEEQNKKKWGFGVHFGKKSSASSSDSGDKQPSGKSSGGIKWKPPKIHFKTKASYDVNVSPTEPVVTVAVKQPEVKATVAEGDLQASGAPAEINVSGKLDAPSVELPSVDVDAAVNAQLDAQAELAQTELEISPAKLTGLFSAPPPPSGDVSVSVASSQQVVNGHADLSAGVPEINGREEFVFSGGLGDDDRVRLSTSQVLLATSTPKRVTGADDAAAGSLRATSKVSLDRQRPRSLNLEDESRQSRPTSDTISNRLSTAGSTGRLAPWLTPHFVIVAIDFGTTFSGYAFCFPGDVTSARERGEALPAIHVMRKWEDGDPGAVDMKTPTTLLLTPEREFHSFGFTARNFYHDLSPVEARRWLYFEKFKMALHHCVVRSSVRFLVALDCLLIEKAQYP